MKNRLIMSIIRLLVRLLDKPTETDVGPKLRYWHQGFNSNYVDQVEYPLSYILSCHEANRNVSFLTEKGHCFHVKIDLSK